MVSGLNSNSNSDVHVRRCNLLSFVSCWLAAVGGLGVCAFPSSSKTKVHLTFAVVFFVFSMVISIVNVIIDRRLEDAKEGCGAKVRLINFMVGFVSLAGIGAFALLILIQYSPYDYPSYLADYMAVCEITFFAATMNVFGSFYSDFKGIHLQLSAIASSDLHCTRARTRGQLEQGE